uniref:Peptidase M16 N-terminal domain-containing protein n=1 Tax=Meloidogyne incognita TaxID=6306 RepID=A0A914LBR5_MELIC
MDQITIELNKNVSTTIYRSKKTKLCVAVTNNKSPIIKAQILFATEASDDRGIGHMVEHLVFMRSEKYPYKGFLDTVLNLCYSPEKSNATTSHDNTRFDFSSIGTNSLLKVLEVYFDNLLAPKFTVIFNFYKTFNNSIFANIEFFKV